MKVNQLMKTTAQNFIDCLGEDSQVIISVDFTTTEVLGPIDETAPATACYGKKKWSWKLNDQDTLFALLKMRGVFASYDGDSQMVQNTITRLLHLSKIEQPQTGG